MQQHNAVSTGLRIVLFLVLTGLFMAVVQGSAPSLARASSPSKESFNRFSGEQTHQPQLHLTDAQQFSSADGSLLQTEGNAGSDASLATGNDVNDDLLTAQKNQQSLTMVASGMTLSFGEIEEYADRTIVQEVTVIPPLSWHSQPVTQRIRIEVTAADVTTNDALVLPDLLIGGNVHSRVTGLRGVLGRTADGLTIDLLSAQLQLGLAQNQAAIPLNGALLDPAGNFSAALVTLDTSLAGVGLTLNQIRVTNDAILAQDGYLTLPERLGSWRSDRIQGMVINGEGLQLNAGNPIAFTGITMALGSTRGYPMRSVSATVYPDVRERLYAMRLEGEVLVSIPGDATIVDGWMDLYENGVIASYVNKKQLPEKLAGLKLELEDAQVSADGAMIQAKSAKLTAPDSAGGLSITLNNIVFRAPGKDGCPQRPIGCLSISGGAFKLPELDLGNIASAAPPVQPVQPQPTHLMSGRMLPTDMSAPPPLDSAALAAEIEMAILAAQPMTTAACQDTVQVTSSADSGPGTLRQALIDVCTGGEITFAEQPVDFFILLTTGQLVVDKAVAIYGEQRVYLSGGEASRVFLVGPGAALALDGVTIYDTIRPTEAGAGVLVAGDGTLLTSNETYFFRNGAADGGALMVMPGGTAVLDRTDFFDNRALNRGGAIYALGTLLLTNVQVEGNSGAIGAGLFAAGLTSIDQCVIRDNRATLWGGAVSNEGRMLIANSEISENRANAAGGIDNVGLLSVDGSSIVANQARRNVGISNERSPAIGYPGVAEIIITASSITSNTATDGSIGGITNYDGLAYIERSAIVSNVAEDTSNIAHVGLTPDARTILQDVTVSGGSASSSVLGAVTIAGSGAVTLTNVTVAANHEAGIVYWAEEGLPAPQVTVRNSLVALNAGKDFGTAVSQPDGSAQPANTPFTLTTSGHNLFGIADNVVGLDGTTDRFGSLAQPLDPAISSLELSTNTYVHPLQPGSPAIDGGRNPCSPVDQRSMPRQGACDIGAFEFDYNIYYLDLDTRRDQASYLLNDLYPAQSGAGVTAQVYAGVLTTVDLGVGLAATGEALPVSYGQTLTVGAEARFLYVAADPGGQRHVTLVIGRDDNGNDQYDPEEELCRSAVSSAVVQVCSLDKNMLVPGNYWLYVVQPEGAATTVDLLISDGSALAGFALAAAPAAVTLGQPFDVRLFWQAPLAIGAARAGVIEIVDQSAPAQVMAPIGFRLTRLPIDVAKSARVPDDELLAPGETISYTITVLPEPAAIHEGITVYTLTDTLPDGVTYVAGSATVTPTSISGNTLVWRLDTQGVTTTVRYQVQVGMATRGLLTNTVVATLDLPNAGATASATVVEVADVILDISMAAPTAIAGGPITYTFTITNEGVGASDPLTVRTVVPANTLHRSGGSVDADGVVTWQLPALAAGGATQVQMAVDPLGVGMAQLSQAARTTAATDAPDIVGGGPADLGAWPWQVALLGKASNRQFCGGSLIAPDLVLTAAHCFVENSTERVADIISIWVGAHDLTELDQGQIIDVSHVALHPGYDPYTLDYDIALLRLAEPAQLSAAVQPVQLATRADEDRYRPGTVAAVTGWGELAYGGESPDILHEVSVGIVDQNACDAVYSTLAGEPGIITDRMICAGFPEGGKDSCRGDSGGPLVVPDGAGGWLQVGIVSWGAAPEDQPACAAAGYPGVYASVPTLLNWIEGPGQSTYMAPEYVEVTDGSGRPGGTAIDYGALVSTVVGLWERVFLPTVVK